MTNSLHPPISNGLRRQRFGRGSSQGRLFAWLFLAIAGLLVIPVISVLSNIFKSGNGTWAHLVDTVLLDYLLNTLALAVFVGVGVPVIGVATAWLVTMCRFPLRRFFEWALILPLAFPAYVLAYTYTDFLQPAGAHHGEGVRIPLRK